MKSFVQIGATPLGPKGTPIPLSPATEANGFLFVSGQLAIRDGGIVGSDIATQTSAAIDALEAVLAEAGLGLEHVVRTGVWLTRIADYPDFNAVYAGRFAPPFPARATVVSDLAVPGALVEIEATAVRPA